MRVLISGASGFVGANVLGYMMENTDWTFVAPCSWRHKGNPSRLNRVLDTEDKRHRVKIVSMDLRHPVPDLGEFDAILNLASESHVDRSIMHPVAFIENNVSVALQMLEYARMHPCQRFVQFSCYDADTRAVTTEGLKRWDEIHEGDMVLSLNPETRLAEWKPVARVHAMPYEGDMVWFRSSRVDLLTTPNHRMLISESTTGKWVWREASKQAVRSTGRLPMPVGSPGKRPPTIEVPGFGDVDSCDLLFLLGAFIGDGHAGTRTKETPSLTGQRGKGSGPHDPDTGRFIKGRTGSAEISVQHSYRTFFEVPDNDRCRPRLIETLTRVGIKYSGYKKNVYVGGKAWVDFFCSQCGTYASNKRIPSWVFELDESLLQHLLDGLMLTDGHYRPRGLIWVYTTISDDLAAGVAALAHQLGWRVRIGQRKSEGVIKGRRIVSQMVNDVVLTRTRASQVHKGVVSTVPYQGTVWCLTVPENRNFLVERNGRFAFCGNSDEVFGPDGEGPSSPYAASKAAQESIAHAYRRTYDVPVVVTNSSNIIGPMQDAEKFLPRVTRAVLSGGVVTIHQHLGVVGSRFYDVVDNVASALVFICERTMSGEYQLGPGTELTNLEMAQRIADTLELPLNYELVEVGSIRPGYDQHYHHVGNILSGWEPVSTFDEGLVRAVDAPAVVPR